MSCCKLICGLSLGLVGAAALACEYPSLPVIPEDGRIRGRAERTVKEDVIQYVKAMSVYVACVQAERSAAVRDGAPDLQVSLLATRNNDAVAELEAVRDMYVEKVGPFEELFFELPFDSGDRRRDAAPRLQRAPERHSLIRMGDQCTKASACGFPQ